MRALFARLTPAQRGPTRAALAPLAPALLAVATCAAPLRAGPAEEAAVGLLERSGTPAEAARAWADAKLDPDQAWKLVRELPPLGDAPTADHEVTLRDAHRRETDLQVLLPPDGPDERGKYGVVILLHGLGGDSKQGLGIGRSFVPPHTILIAPSAKEPPADAGYEDLRTAGAAGIPVMKRFKHWWSYREDAFPLLGLDHVKRRWPIDTNRVLLIGYSMGGFGTWNLGLRYHDLFAALLPMAGGISREEFFLGKDELVRQLLDNARGLPLFFVHGDQDEVVPVRFDQASRDDLEKRQIPFIYEEVKGGKHKLTEVLDPTHAMVKQLKAFVDAQVRDPHPRRVVHRSIGAYHPGAFWVRIDGRSGAASAVVAEVVKKNAIAVETRGVTRLTLFLDPQLVDPDKRLQVVVDGKPAFKGKVKPSLEAVAESYARTHDPELTYRHMLTLDVEARTEAPGEADGSWLKPRR